MTSIDPKFEIHWQLDDGTQAIGPVVKHCFEKYGEHTAQMNLKDTETGIIYENEYTANISINPPAALKLLIADSLNIELPVNVDYDLLGEYTVNKIQWSIDGQALTVEEMNTYKFSGPGTAQFDLSLDLVFNDQPYAICARKEVIVFGSNIMLASFEKFYDQEGNGKSRFLNAPYNLAILNKTKPALSKTIEVQKQGGYYQVEPESNYELWTWHGNSFSEKVKVSTEGLNQLASQSAFDEALDRLVETKPVELSPVFHEFDKPKLDESSMRVLDQNLALLKDYQNYIVLIGSYTHTGGFLRSNLNLSKERSQLVKKYLVTGGLASDRIVVADPMKEKELINSCGFVGCEGEDTSLNRRTDFKLMVSEKPI